MKKEANVLQHQYAIIKSNDESIYLATKGIWTCTGWYGWDANKNVAFLCHFDSPWSAKATTKILNELASLEGAHQFESVLIGGKKWFFGWSWLTRITVMRIVKARNDLSINISNGPYDNFPNAKRCVTIFPAAKSKYSNEYIEGRTCPPGILWFFGPILKAKVSL